MSLEIFHKHRFFQLYHQRSGMMSRMLAKETALIFLPRGERTECVNSMVAMLLVLRICLVLSMAHQCSHDNTGRAEHFFFLNTTLEQQKTFKYYTRTVVENDDGIFIH